MRGGVEEEAHGRFTRCSILHLGVLPVPLAPQEGERGPRDQQLAGREHQGLPAEPEMSHMMKGCSKRGQECWINSGTRQGTF